MALCDKFVVLGTEKLNVYDFDKLVANQDVLVSDDQTAVEMMHDGKQLVLPVREMPENGDMSKVGVYFGDGPMYEVNFPSKEEEHKYIPKPDNVFDLQNMKTLQDYVTMKEAYDNTTMALLETDPDDESITRPPLLNNDSPEMRALKECIILKAIDLDKYASRFGVNYPNDKRKLKDSDITSYMLKRICTNTDIEVDIVFRDAPGQIANPMGKQVRVNMIPGYSNAAIIEDV